MITERVATGIVELVNKSYRKGCEYLYCKGREKIPVVDFIAEARTQVVGQGIYAHDHEWRHYKIAQIQPENFVSKLKQKNLNRLSQDS